MLSEFCTKVVILTSTSTPLIPLRGLKVTMKTQSKVFSEKGYSTSMLLVLPKFLTASLGPHQRMCLLHSWANWCSHQIFSQCLGRTLLQLYPWMRKEHGSDLTQMSLSGISLFLFWWMLGLIKWHFLIQWCRAVAIGGLRRRNSLSKVIHRKWSKEGKQKYGAGDLDESPLLGSLSCTMAVCC